MSRGKWIIAFLCVPAALLGAALLRSGHISGRLQAEGVETKAVLTGSSSRAEFVGYRPRSRRYRGKHTVCYFDYRYVVGGQTYTGKVRKKENLHTARIGDSVVVRYLPDDPGVHRLVTDSAGRYERPRSRLPARSICNSGYKIVCLQGSSTRIHLKMTRFFFLLAALPYFAGSAAAHPAILPDSSAVVRLDTAASGRTVYLRVDEPPRFQGGDVLAFRDWVFRHLCFGGEMFREGVEARLVVSFVVGRQGAVEEPEVVSSTDERCSAEVLRVLASAPRWTPGRLGNVAVRTKLVMPVNIQLAVPTAADSLAAGLSDGIPLEEDVAGELERMPLFQGGDLQSFRKWVMENLKYPREALEDEVEDDIVVTFIVEKDGTLSEIVVEQGLNLALIREVGRVLTLSPKWEPGRLGNGEPVQVRYTLPLIFRLDRTRPAGQPVRPSVPGREVRVGVDDYSRF